MWRVLEGQQVVNLVEVSVEAVVRPVDADHDVFNWNVRRQTDGVLDVQVRLDTGVRVLRVGAIVERLEGEGGV